MSQRAPAAEVPGEVPAKLSPTYGSLVGNWLGSPYCTLVFLKDDGKSVEGSCDTAGVRHRFTGRYDTENTVKITITRIDEKQCAVRADGYIIIENSDTIEVGQEAWDGCGVKTEPAKTRLRRQV